MLRILNSDKLSVEITSAGAAPNDGFRFDRTGYISEVTLSDGTRFCASEPRNLAHPSSQGRGFCSCLRTRLGDDWPKGSYLPLWGIGLIKKPDDGRYIQFLRYDEGFVPFAIKESFGESTAEWEVEPLDCNGYAISEKRSVCVEGDTLVNTVTLENKGTNAVDIMEYCHNFISIEGMAVGPDYTIVFPQVPDMTGEEVLDAEKGDETNFVGYGRGWKMKGYTPRDRSAALSDYSFYTGEPFVWRIENSAAGAFVEGTDYIALDRVKIWTCDHMVCPEIYQKLHLEPGESVTWHRDLRFGRL